MSGFNVTEHPSSSGYLSRHGSPSFDGGDGSGHDGGMEARLAALEAKWEAVVPTLATKSDVAELRGDMHEMNAGISRWMLGTVLTVIGTVVLGFVGLAFAGYNALKPAAQSAASVQPAPIIINVPSAATPVAPKASGP